MERSIEAKERGQNSRSALCSYIFWNPSRDGRMRCAVEDEVMTDGREKGRMEMMV